MTRAFFTATWPERVMTGPMVSPDGRCAIHFNTFEMRMSHWVNAPLVIESASGTVLFSLGETLWSADRAEWSADSRRVLFTLRRYPGDAPALTLVLDLDGRVALVRAQNQAAEVPFDAVGDWLENWYRSQTDPD